MGRVLTLSRHRPHPVTKSLSQLRADRPCAETTLCRDATVARCRPFQLPRHIAQIPRVRGFRERRHHRDPAHDLAAPGAAQVERRKDNRRPEPVSHPVEARPPLRKAEAV